ncbi:MAG: hypothetical protein HY561_08090 [Gemmatimonadetes bacterium]|nr:hypothetical protein [Gemmatimonadota bacterium]
MTTPTKLALGLLVLLSTATSAAGQRGAVKGTVSYRGPAPTPEQLKVTTDADVCGATVPSRHLLVRNSRVANSVVFLEGPIPVATRSSAVTLANVRCDFDPPVQVAEAGAVLTLRNLDPLMHNVHLYHTRRTVGNFGLPGRGVEVKNRRALARPGLIEVECDAHEWMRAAIWVFDHPYYALTAPDGVFEIRDVPPGRYVLHSWHAQLGELRREIVIQDGQIASLDFVFGS